MEQLQKQYKELTFTDDFMFGKVLVNNPEICRRLLEVLLEIRIKKISFPERQKTIEILSDGKRSRYYQGMIDMNLIERGAKYKELKLSFVIFICLKDPFGYRLPVYRFENICIQSKDILLKDEAIKVFINADGDLTGLPENLAAFLKYLKGVVVDNELVQMIDNEVEKVREHKEWEVEYMTSYLRDMDIREEGIEIGLAQGLEQGLLALINTVKSFTGDAEEIYQAIIKNEAYKNTPREEVLKYLQ